MMPLRACFTVALLAAAVATGCRSVSDSEPGAVRLFNGKNLDNWKAVLEKPEVAKESVWSVRDGILICKGEPLGYLQSEKSYTNFRLSLEWRWAPGKKPGNSGVFLRVNGVPRPLPRCIECQLQSGDAGAVYGFHGMKIDGDKARRIEVKNHELGGDFVGVKKLVAAENPPGEWNRYDITIEGDRLGVAVNGKVVNEAYGCEVVAGPIGLQSEGGEIHFRNVMLTPLP